MPMKLSVGLSRKIAGANYSSRGASCNVEVELDIATVADDPIRFQQRVQEAFAACRKAVQNELANATDSADSDHCANGRAASESSGGQAVRTNKGARPATAAQVKAIRAIAHRAGIQLAAELSHRYDVSSPEALDLRQASHLIDALKEQLDAQPVAG